MKFRFSKLGGFTRLEALAIFVLLIVVAGVTIPYLQSKAREAKRVQSAQNLRQWGIALNLFLVENQNRLPDPGATQPDPDNLWAWYNTLPLYIGQRSLAELTPEEMRRVPVWNDPSMEAHASTDGHVFSYAMNGWLRPKSASAPLRIYDLEDPSATVFLVETESLRPGIRPPMVSFRHGRKRDPHPEASAHVLFADGHVRLVPRSQLVDDPKVSDPNAKDMGKLTWVPYFGAPPPAE